MAELVILVPALHRPHRVRPLLKSIRGASPGARVLFICDPEDAEEQKAVEVAGGELIVEGGKYAHKINRAVARTSEPLLFLGADDLEFRPGWYEAARAYLDRAEVVGINDLIQRDRDHTTHFLITRAYAERPTIDGQVGPLCESYAHNCVDDELIATADKRGVYAYAEDAHVKHLHPMNGTADMDPVYGKGMASLRRDKQLLHRRRQRLWAR